MSLIRRPLIKPWTAAFVALTSFAVALGLFQLDRRLGPRQQRVNVRWVTGLSAPDRGAAEAALRLQDGEELEADKWVYRLGDRSRSGVRQIVGDPRVADTAHIDRQRLRVILDAPNIPAWLRRALEARLASPLALLGVIVGFATIVLARRELGRALLQVATGPAGAPRHVQPVRPEAVHPLPRRLGALVLGIQDEWDWWATRAYFPLIGVLLGLMLIYTVSHGRELALAWDGWTIADWLITYAGGFVRRGLSGELVFTTSRALGLALNTTAWVLFVLTFAIGCLAFGALLLVKRVTFWYFVLCLSPAFVLFTLYNPDTVGRKDWLLVAAVAAWSAMAARHPPTVRRSAVFALIAFVATLMHELFFFFTPYFLLLSYLRARQLHSTERWWSSALIPLGGVLAILLVLSSSGSLSAAPLCTRIIASGAPASVCEGVLSYGRESIRDGVQDFLRATQHLSLSVLGEAVTLTLLPPMLFLLVASRTTRIGATGIVAVVGALVFSAPLFVLALDWGRWLAIHATLTTVICAMLLPERNVLPFRPPLTWRSVASIVVGLAVMATMFGWSIKHCCRDTLVMPFTPIETIGAIWEDLDL